MESLNTFKKASCKVGCKKFILTAVVSGHEISQASAAACFDASAAKRASTCLTASSGSKASRACLTSVFKYIQSKRRSFLASIEAEARF